MAGKKKSSGQTAKQQAKTTAEGIARTAENIGLAAPSTADVQQARDEGVTEAIKENTKESYKYATDGQLPGEPQTPQIVNTGEHSNFIDGLLGLGPNELEARIDPDADNALTDQQVANLLALERNGPNRTDHVKLLCKRLGLETPHGVPGAGGPAYTNDITAITPITRPGG